MSNTGSVSYTHLDVYKRQLSPWLISIKAGSTPVNILIDPGPSSAIPSLACALDELNISNLDWILLTHIHIDHAGGVGLLISQYPSAKVLVHHRGIRHLANPERLWQGSVNTLGDLAHLYGEIVPVPEDVYKRQGRDCSRGSSDL